MGRLIGIALLGLALVGLGRMMFAMSPTAAEASTTVVRPLVDQTISARGLGELQLGTTRLVDVIERFGIGRPSLLLGDDLGVEIQFAEGNLCLMFCAEYGGTAHRKAMRDGPRGPSLAMHAGPAVLMERYPEFGELPLTSISVRRPWFRGTTSQGVALGADFAEVRRRHPEGGAATRDPFVAGTATAEPLARPHHSAGLSFFPDRDPADRSPASGAFDPRRPVTGAELEMIVAYRPGF